MIGSIHSREDIMEELFHYELGEEALVMIFKRKEGTIRITFDKSSNIVFLRTSRSKRLIRFSDLNYVRFAEVSTIDCIMSIKLANDSEELNLGKLDCETAKKIKTELTSQISVIN
ncbi:MAG: hypothetical protein OEY19_10975 [Gammaproteobacteria bacterium]|nr:hypothetical protein [Gammaproteobacteria bacterium]